MSKQKPLTTSETAARLGLAVSTVRKQVERGKLKPGRFGTALAFEVAEVERYERENLGKAGKPRKGKK